MPSAAKGGSRQRHRPLTRWPDHHAARAGGRDGPAGGLHHHAGQRGDAPVAPDLITSLPASSTLAADRAYDGDALRCLLLARGTTPVIPNGPRRKNLHPFDRTASSANLVERAFCRIKDFRRVATRYDKLAKTYAAAISLAAPVTWWF